MQQPIRIAPSILSADFARLGEDITAVDAAGGDYIHVDVMDGHFVPNLTIGPCVVKAIRPYTKKPLDVHLMVAPVDPLIDEFVAAGADILTVHVESGPHTHRSLQAIKKHGIRCGVSLCPTTPVSAIESLLDMVDLILVMTVNPGFGGQAFIASQLSKIAALRQMIDRSGRVIDLQVDGGINPVTAQQVVNAGADVLVAGTAVFKDGAQHYASHIASLRVKPLQQ